MSAVPTAQAQSVAVWAWRRLLLVATLSTPTNVALAAAAERLGLAAEIVSPDAALALAGPGDILLGRIDVRRSLDGPEPGLTELRQVAAAGVDVVNGHGGLLTAHDKLATALALARAGLPHPRTALVSRAGPLPFAPPYVVKPRFGSWGRDVERVQSEADLAAQLTRLRERGWFRRQGALVQELVSSEGRDLRLVIAAGRVVGAVERVARPGEWRTNVSLGAERRPVSPPLAAHRLALRAAAAVACDLVGVDLLRDDAGAWVVIELNAAVEFNETYALGAEDVHEAALGALLDARAARATGLPAA